MLKNKTGLYVLFPLVIIIWGIVIYRVLGAFGDDKVIVPVPPRAVGEEITKMKKDTFSLLPVERDPFLGHYYKKPVPQKPKAKTPVEKQQWPEISYLGLISDIGQSSEVHILQVNGRQIILEKGGTAQEIKMIGSKPGQVTLFYRGEKKTFSKNN